MNSPVRSVALPGGDSMPVLGLGTWRMGEDRRAREAEVSALRLGLDLGMTLVDTAEMYGEGGAEEVAGAAIRGRRDEVFLVSKVYPHNATRRGTVAACERSLARLGTDRLDLYLLHWRGSVPLSETLEAFARLRDAGKIRHWGVSNFDTADMAELVAAGGESCAANQVLYNLERRGVEWDLLPWCTGRGVPLMAYSPLGQGPLLRRRALREVARRHDSTPAEVALAWLLRRPGVVAIPKAADPAHLRANRRAHDLELDTDDLAALDAAFPPPARATPLEMI